MNKSGVAGAYCLMERKKKREDIIGPKATVTVVQHQAETRPAIRPRRVCYTAGICLIDLRPLFC
jgi:hypothetical protein